VFNDGLMMEEVTNNLFIICSYQQLLLLVFGCLASF